MLSTVEMLKTLLSTRLLYLLFILGVDWGLVFLIVDGADNGIKSHAKCQQESNDGNADS